MKIYDYNGKKNICGDRLREARVVRRLRQEDLAAQIQLKGINMERDSISRIEIGTRFVSDFELKIFAEVLGVSVNWLLGIDESRRRARRGCCRRMRKAGGLPACPSYRF